MRRWVGFFGSVAVATLASVSCFSTDACSGGGPCHSDLDCLGQVCVFPAGGCGYGGPEGRCVDNAPTCSKASAQPTCTCGGVYDPTGCGPGGIGWSSGATGTSPAGSSDTSCFPCGGVGKVCPSTAPPGMFSCGSGCAPCVFCKIGAECCVWVSDGADGGAEVSCAPSSSAKCSDCFGACSCSGYGTNEEIVVCGGGSPGGAIDGGADAPGDAGARDAPMEAATDGATDGLGD